MLLVRVQPNRLPLLLGIQKPSSDTTHSEVAGKVRMLQHIGFLSWGRGTKTLPASSGGLN